MNARRYPSLGGFAVDTQDRLRYAPARAFRQYPRFTGVLAHTITYTYRAHRAIAAFNSPSHRDVHCPGPRALMRWPKSEFRLSQNQGIRSQMVSGTFFTACER